MERQLSYDETREAFNQLGKRSRKELEGEDSEEFWTEVCVLARHGMRHSIIVRDIERKLRHMLRGTVLRINGDTPYGTDDDKTPDETEKE